MGKFFNGQVKRDRTSLIRYIIIGCGIFFIIFLFILIAAKSGKNKDNAILEPKKTYTMEINSDWPEAKDLFDKIENFDVNLITVEYNNLDITELGEYEVTVKAENHGSAQVKVIVADQTVPELILKDVEISQGYAYDIEDFVESCNDNSHSECILSYYDKATDVSGRLIDYSSFTEPGSYIIKIIAKDASDNETPIKEAKLTILEDGQGGGNGGNSDNCYFGNLSVSNSRVSYPIAVVVGDQNANCALDRNLWDDPNIQEPVNKFYKEDYEALKKDTDEILRSNFPNGAKIVAYPNFIAVLNDEIKGLVGYAIYVKVYIVANDYDGTIDKDENLAVSYYIRQDHTRQYDYNKYNIK